MRNLKEICLSAICLVLLLFTTGKSQAQYATATATASVSQASVGVQYQPVQQLQQVQAVQQQQVYTGLGGSVTTATLVPVLQSSIFVGAPQFALGGFGLSPGIFVGGLGGTAFIGGRGIFGGRRGGVAFVGGRRGRIFR